MSIQFFPFVCLAAHDWKFLRWTPTYTSNFYCHPGKAGGFPIGLTPTLAREAYGRLDEGVRQFLASMRVPDEVVRQMFATPSTSMKYFTANEFNRQVGFVQPWFDELAKSACTTTTPDEEFKCMGLRSSLDRLNMLNMYFGPQVADAQAGWSAEFRTLLTSQSKAKPKTESAEQPAIAQKRNERVDAAHPGWEALVHTREFDIWLKAQSLDVQRLAASDVQDDAILLLSLYKKRDAAKANLRYLSCDTEMDARDRKRTHFDFTVDFDAQSVGAEKADISSESIYFDSALPDGDTITTRISRRSGAITLRNVSMTLRHHGALI